MRAALAAVLLALVLPAAASAAPRLVPVGTFAQPVHVAGPPGDRRRLFVVERAGRVQVMVDGQRTAAPFLDLTADVGDGGTEQGLLSIAFAPDYVASGRFFVFYTDDAGDLVVREGRRSASDPNRGSAGTVLFTIDHPLADNHNGGQLAFGPDGALYASTGDGGTYGDPEEDAQDPAGLLGKILRIDLAAPSSPQVWALGLRNPWRFSFDRSTGDMLIGDVGSETAEEIDFGPAGVAGLNYGWNDCEGNPPGGCPLAGARPAALSLARDDGYRAVIGGFVVRDPALPSLAGRYLFGDIGQGTVMSAVVRDTGSDLRPEPGLRVSFPTSFGEDGCGRVYVAENGGGVSRIEDGTPGPCSPPFRPLAQPPGGAAGDTTPCAVRVVSRRPQRILRRGRRLRVALVASEACTATLRARRFRTKRVALRAGVKRSVRLAPTRRGLRRLRRAVARSERHRLRITVRISTRDAAGNASVVRVRRTVR